MGLDFSAFLLNYLQRYFLKSHEIVNILLVITTVIIASLAIIATISPKMVDVRILVISDLTLAVLFFVVIVYIPNHSKKGNEKISEIENTIILNYDHINGRSDMNKRNILNQLKVVIAHKFNEKDVDELIKQLSIRYPV